MEIHSGGSLDPRKYDAFIFQKVFDDTAAHDARTLRQMGKIVAWDLCEPMWWSYPQQHIHMASEVSFAVACSKNLAELARQEIGIDCHVISDRHDPAFHPMIKTHIDRVALRMIWFGYSGNRYTLRAVLPFLERLKTHGRSFELIVIDDQPEIELKGLPCPVIHKPWDLKTFHEDMLEADVALLPIHPEPLGRYKSNNKAMTAAWCGLPVVSGSDWNELCAVFDSEFRAIVGKQNRESAEKDYDVHLSVKEWMTCISQHKHR
jgi:hypothetical protein